MAMKVRYTVLDGEIVEENRNGVITDYVGDPPNWWGWGILPFPFNGSEADRIKAGQKLCCYDRFGDPYDAPKDIG